MAADQRVGAFHVVPMPYGRLDRVLAVVRTNRIREAFRGPTQRANVRKLTFNLQLHQDDPASRSIPVETRA